MSQSVHPGQTSGITIVGLGPGGAELITRQAWEVLSGAKTILLRTERHPAVTALPESAEQISFDHLYESQDSFSEVYEAIARSVVDLGQAEPVIYAVPGHPHVGEATVPLIRRKAREAGIPLRILDGLSFVEPALRAVELDALDGLQLFDAISLADLPYPPLNPDRPALLAQVYNQFLASALKLALMAIYDDEQQVALIHAAATAAEQVEWLPLYAIDRSPLLGHLTSLYLPPSPEASSLATLADTVAVLRGPGGCPWDQEQTASSLRPGLLEEMAELLEAIDLDDPDHMAEELGDLLFHIVMQAQIAREEGTFSLAQVIAGIAGKLRRRHPHVWGGWEVADTGEVLRNWEALKAQEKGRRKESLLDGLPRTLPALATSQKIQHRVSQIGFDWPDLDGVLAKLAEEQRELMQAASVGEKQAELGDMLFVTAHLANWLELDAETALREANHRFGRRFRRLEQLAAERAMTLSELSTEALNQLWDEVKQALSSSPAE